MGSRGGGGVLKTTRGGGEGRMRCTRGRSGELKIVCYICCPRHSPRFPRRLLVEVLEVLEVLNRAVAGRSSSCLPKATLSPSSRRPKRRPTNAAAARVRSFAPS